MINQEIYDKIVVMKPLIPVGGKDIGALPGDKFEKIAAWLGPIKDNIDQILGAKTLSANNRFEEMCREGIIEVEAMAFIQGRSIPRSIIILDEADTMTSDSQFALRRIMEEETNAIIVASYGTFSTGINIKNLHNIIFASPYKSRIKVLQSIGRVLRKGKNKDEAVLYDIADDMRVGNHMNSTLRHFVERVKIYNEEKFSFKIYNIGLKNGSTDSKT